MDMEKTLVTYIHRIDEDTIRHHNYNVHHNMVPTKAFIGKFRRDGSEKLLKEKEVNEKDKEYPVNGPIINLGLSKLNKLDMSSRSITFPVSK